MKLIQPIYLLLVASLLLAVFAGNCFAQSGCSLLDKSKKAQFITYEGYGDFEGIKLRLTNNTTCSITVQRSGNVPMRPVKLSNGRSVMQFPTRPEDGTIIGLNYLVQNRKRWRAPEQGYGWGDSVYTYDIPAGQSVIFSVSLLHFKKQLDIVVPFKYEWESNSTIGMGVGGVNHYVYFLADDLPEDAVKIVRRCCR